MRKDQRQDRNRNRKDFAARDKYPMAHFAPVADAVKNAAKDHAVAADNLAAVDNPAASAVADTQVAFVVVDILVDNHNQAGRCTRAASADSLVDSRSREGNHSRAASAVEDNQAGSHNPEDNQADSRAASAAGDNLAGSRAAFAVVAAVAAVAVAEVVAAQPVPDAADTKPATGHGTPS